MRLTERENETTQHAEPKPPDAEHQIRELKTALENSLSATEAAERKAELASKAIRDMEHFNYGFAHDLKSSLRSILSFTQLLERKLPVDAEIRDLTGPIIAGAGDMQLLIENVQKLFNIRKQTGRTNVGLDIVVQLAVLRVQPMVKASGASIQFAHLPHVLVNESLFVQLFEQLLTNSLIYHGEEPPRIEIRSEENDEVHTISVHDNGVGVPPDYQKSIFEPFKRLHGSKVPGAGLGLTISQKIVEAHHGELWVESDGQTGSTFLFTIPI